MSLYATLLKIRVGKLRAKVRTRFWGEGSVRAETVRTGCAGIETTLEMESDEDPAQIAKLARVAEAGCFVIQTLKNPAPVTYRVVLNGKPLKVSAEGTSGGQ
ncbi:MAG: OsmC family protein [Acidobacteria bacterium]|nr:OsmC family protein [Acidobacteriota bacterium]